MFKQYVCVRRQTEIIVFLNLAYHGFYTGDATVSVPGLVVDVESWSQ